MNFLTAFCSAWQSVGVLLGFLSGGKMIDRDRLRAIYADEFGGLALADDMATRIKRAMFHAAEAQRDADAALALAQSGRRKPVLVCGSCAQFVADTIRGNNET